MIIPSQERLMRFVYYDAATGLFTWKARGRCRYSGKYAGDRHPSGYLTLTIEKTTYRAHKLAWFYVYGKMPELLDHINGNPSDNRIANLRECTPAQNAQNRRKNCSKAIASKGVFYEHRTGRWEAKIMAFGTKRHLGTFATEAEGAEAYDAAAREMHREFARLNKAS